MKPNIKTVIKWYKNIDYAWNRFTVILLKDKTTGEYIIIDSTFRDYSLLETSIRYHGVALDLTEEEIKQYPGGWLLPSPAFGSNLSRPYDPIHLDEDRYEIIGWSDVNALIPDDLIEQYKQRHPEESFKENKIPQFVNGNIESGGDTKDASEMEYTDFTTSINWNTGIPAPDTGKVLVIVLAKEYDGYATASYIEYKPQIGWIEGSHVDENNEIQYSVLTEKYNYEVIGWISHTSKVIEEFGGK